MTLSPSEKVEEGIRKLKQDGHTVVMELRNGERGTKCFNVDGRMIVSWEEMQELGVGLYSLAELAARQKPG